MLRIIPISLVLVNQLKTRSHVPVTTDRLTETTGTWGRYLNFVWKSKTRKNTNKYLATSYLQSKN